MGKWDWTVKVDCDAVFLPSRLRDYLGKVEVTNNGIYLENCKYVNYGFFGSLEGFSKKAASTYMANLDDCVETLNYKGSEKVTGNEPWGEDLFAQRCMDLHQVDRVAPLTSTLMHLAQCGALRARRKTGNGAPIAPRCKPRQFTTSKHPKS